MKQSSPLLTPEILAPAGGIEALQAAVRCGADAIYLGLSVLNARKNAQNFALDSLQEAVRYCHLCGVKVYLTLNTLVFDAEFLLLEQLLRVACDAPVDAIIVQDMGVVHAVQAWCPQMPLHASTQMTVHTTAGARLLRRLGFSRVVLARELSQMQIEQILKQTQDQPIETELFVHGALCVSVSGQCYMSALIGTRSGNKGSCAGTCRLPFSVCKQKEKSGHKRVQDQYALSLKDNCLVTHQAALKTLGVTALKIEGRMKRPEYVAGVVQAYVGMRAGLPPDLARLRAIFSRNGFTDGYFTGKFTPHMFGVRTKPSDGNTHTHTRKQPQQQNQVLEEYATQSTGTLAAHAGPESLPLPQLYKELQESYRKEPPRYLVSMELVVEGDKPATLTLRTGGYTVTVTGDLPEPAHTAPLSLQMAQQVLQKFGGTPFYAKELQGKIVSGYTLKKSQLSQMRRQAVQALSDQIAYKPPIPFAITAMPIPPKHICKKLQFCARFATFSQIPFARLSALAWFSLPISVVVRHAEKLLPYQKKLVVEPDRVMFGQEEQTLAMLTTLSQQGYINLAASNLAHLELGRMCRMNLFGTAFLNITNAYSVQAYQQLGVCQTELSFELRREQLNHIAGKVPLGFVAYGHLPVMVLTNCPLKQGSKNPCGGCSGTGSLIDRKEERFLVQCQQKRYSELFNPRPIWLADRLTDFTQMNFATLYFTRETKMQCDTAIQAYLAGGNNAVAPPTEGGTFTRGIYYRGVE